MTRLISKSLRSLGRSSLLAWSRTGRLLGYHYQLIDRYGRNLSEPEPLVRSLPNGCRIRCDLSDEVQRLIWFYGAYEPIEAYLFTRLIRPGMTVVDAGANAGQYTLLASTGVGPSGSVNSFEPIPATFERLGRAVAENGLSNVHLNQAALWHEEATLRFGLNEVDRNKNNSGGYRVGSSNTDGPTIEARAIRLDDYVAGRGLDRVDLIKMDIEGAEASALAGARETLARHRPTFLMEVNADTLRDVGSDPAAIWAELQPFGYRAWEIGISTRDSGPVSDPSSIENANVLFHHDDLPAEVTDGWTLRSVLRWARGGS